MTTSQIMETLNRCWVPDPNYNFAADAEHLKRKFNFKWLDMYSPWLKYSKKLKGAFCLYCVLFPPKVVRGQVGSFIIRPFTKYKDVHSFCKMHVANQWHKDAVSSAKDFGNTSSNVDIVMQKGHKKNIEQNRNILKSVIKTIIFCGTHDLPLRSKYNDGVFLDILKLRIDSGDELLKLHMETFKQNAKYTSPDIQNQIIKICGDLLQEYIINKVKSASAYSILADESSDISGKEQLSIGIRFFDKEEKCVKEEFIGFVELEKMDAQAIAMAIKEFIQKLNIDVTRCVGQGYDGCSTMAGKYGGVQKLMRETFQKALFFHCASHRLNLVVNDLNTVPVVRNCIATVKDIINFFRESVLRQKYAPKIPMLCETRWSYKYKSISMFKKNFIGIVTGLEKLSIEGNTATRKLATQLLAASQQTTFILAFFLIDKYSTILEPTVNVLQSKHVDILKCSQHIKKIMDIVKAHRTFIENESQKLLEFANETAEILDIELRVPRIVNRQQHRSNQPASSLKQYFERSMYIPYLDCLLNALEMRFSDENTPAFKLSLLHPLNLQSASKIELEQSFKDIEQFYKINNLETEIELWRSLWMKKENIDDLTLVEVIEEANIFYPNIRKALEILLVLPYTTATIERSFSTLRRVKTWLRSTMETNRLSGLCMLSVHRQIVTKLGDIFIEGVLNRFAEDPRKLIFL